MFFQQWTVDAKMHVYKILSNFWVDSIPSLYQNDKKFIEINKHFSRSKFLKRKTGWGCEGEAVKLHESRPLQFPGGYYPD